MNRNLAQLSDRIYDLIIIGGGIYGACVAWEASLRGLSVALVEKADFGSATSANSLKIVHGGLRYLQHADFKRMRESIQERKTLMRIAPHLVHPLPIVIPTYGHGIKGREALGLAMKINDIISCDRNSNLDSQKHIPNGRLVSPDRCQQLLPDIPTRGLTGGAIFHDAQVYNSERLTLAMIRSAQQAGATVANYVRVTGFRQTGNCITGVKAEDTLTGDLFEIRAAMVVNTCGAWINNVLNLLEKSPQPKTLFAKAMNLVIDRPLFGAYAAGISGSQAANQPKRFLFIAPWRGKSMIGTYYAPYDGDSENFQITEADIQQFLDRINDVYPPANLTRNDVSFVHGGLLPRTSINLQTGEPVLAKHYQIEDYARVGLSGLISVVGVKYTTARDVAQKTVDRIFRLWGVKPPSSKSATTPVYGGEIDKFQAFLDDSIKNYADEFSLETIHRLVYNYGSAYPDVLRYLEENSYSLSTDTQSLAVLKAEVIYAVREEMAQKLSDVVFRRTELGSAGYPGDRYLQLCAEIMSTELGWSRTRIQQELQEVNDVYRRESLVEA